MEHIIAFIKSASGNDKILLDLLKELVLFEIDSPGWFKDTYKGYIDRVIDKWEIKK